MSVFANFSDTDSGAVEGLPIEWVRREIIAKADFV
jgi:hypothetical protein